MAAIDKLYLNSYAELSDLRSWAILYYPRLIAYFYSNIFTMPYSEFERAIRNNAKIAKRQYKAQWEKISADGSIEAAADYLVKKYDASIRDAKEWAEEAYVNANKSIEELMNETSIPIMNTPIKVDRKLKWICPLPCIRKYLQNQCGVTEHWYYKLFWRGRRIFDI